MIGDKPIDANTQADYRWRLSRSPAAVLRRLPAGRDRPPRVPALQGDQAARVRGAAARHRRGRRAARPARAAHHPARAGIDQEAHRDARQHPRRGHRGRAHRAQPSAREPHAHQGAQARANVPRDGRARRRSSTPPASRTARSCQHSMPPASSRTARARKSPEPSRQGMRSKDDRRRAGTLQGHGQLPPGPPRRRGAARLPGSSRDLRNAGAQRHPRQRAVRPARRRGAPARPRRRALPDPRRQDRGGRARGADEPRARRGVRLALRSPAPRRPARRTPTPTPFPTPAAGGSPANASREIVGEAAARASERVGQRGLPPLPHTTPHSLRRTYISIALLANRFDVKWVMGQVGHADSKMTLDVYAQLQQRVKREHGRAFDTLVQAGARAALRHHQRAPRTGLRSGFRPRVGPRGHLRRVGRPEGRADRRAGIQRLAGGSRDGETRTRTGDTTIFSRVLYQLSYLAEGGSGYRAGASARASRSAAAPPPRSAAARRARGRGRGAGGVLLLRGGGDDRPQRAATAEPLAYLPAGTADVVFDLDTREPLVGAGGRAARAARRRTAR